jgi:hypothetical protein
MRKQQNFSKPMAMRGDGLFEKLLHRSALKRWRQLGDLASGLDLESLRRLRGQAWALRRSLDRVIHVAEHHLALPVPGKALICEGSTIFHDCRRSELTVRQIRNTRAADIAPFGVRMDVFRFDGSFLSLVIDLPEAAVTGLRMTHLIRLDAIVEMEKPLEIFARLNIKHGPNVEQVVRELPLNEEEVKVEFDLAYTKMNEKRVERIWVDLIFEGPEMNQIILRDVTLTRRPRADL